MTDTIAKVVKNDIDDLNATLTVTIEKTDYEPLLDKELKKYRQQAAFKGFRQGKTPLSFIKKMYGKQILSDIVNQALENSLNDYIYNAQGKIIGQPLMNDNSPKLDWGLKNLQDFVFIFDIGLSPEFETKGLDGSESFVKDSVELSDSEVEEQLKNTRMRMGERIFVDDQVLDNDLVKLSVKELDGEQLKEGGVESEFVILTSRIDNEALKEELKTKKKGDTLRINIFEIEDSKIDNHAKKYFLNLEGDDLEKEVSPHFEATIIEVSRIEPAVMDQEFFDKLFGEGEVVSVDEAKDKIKEGAEKEFKADTEVLFRYDVRERLIALNKENMPMPEAFLKRWLMTMRKQEDEIYSDEEFERFLDGLRWTIISNKIQESNDMKVTEADIREHLRQEVFSYISQMGGGSLLQIDGFVDQMADRAMQDDKQRSRAVEKLVNDQVFGKIEEMVTIQENGITIDELQEKIKEYNEIQEKFRKEEEGNHDEEE